MNKNNVKKIIYSVIVVLLIIVTFYLVSPLFISTEVNEPLPPNINNSVAFEEFTRMTEDERTNMARSMTNEQKNQMLVQFAELENNSRINDDLNTNVLIESNQSSESATFVGVNDGIHNAEGLAKIIPLSDNSNILRLENLKVTNGPDLYVYLSTDKGASEYVESWEIKS